MFDTYKKLIGIIHYKKKCIVRYSNEQTRSINYLQKS